MSNLEHRFRRLLRWYPADHRAVHEDEMIGVLLADARPGQRRPDRRTVLDLVAGGVRLHARRLFGSPAWRDALSAAQVFAPLMMLIVAGDVLRLAIGFGAAPGTLATAAGWLAVPLLSAVRLRRAAGVCAWLLLAAELTVQATAGDGTVVSVYAMNAYRYLLLLVAAIALSLPLDRQAVRRVLPGAHRWLVPAGVVAAGAFATVVDNNLWALDDPRPIAAFVLFLAVLVAALFRGPVARRCALILFVPFAAGLAGAATQSGVSGRSADQLGIVGSLSTMAGPTLSITVPLVSGFAIVYGLYGLVRLLRIIPPVG